MQQKFINLKQKIQKPYTLCLRNTSKDFTLDSIKKTRSKKSAKVFFVDYNAINTSHILDIH